MTQHPPHRQPRNVVQTSLPRSWIKRSFHARPSEGGGPKLAESGCSNQEIKAVTGHTSDTEVARYTAGASQRRVSDNAYVKVDLANQPKNG